MEGSDPDPSPWHADLFILLYLFGCIGIFVESRGLSGAGYRISVSAGLVAVAHGILVPIQGSNHILRHCKVDS